MKIAITIFITVILLSLLTWWFFFESGEPLTPPETTLIVGVYLVVTLAVRWLWSHFQSRR
jgi:hypothetical protein